MAKCQSRLGFEALEQRRVLTAGTWGWHAFLLPHLEQDNLTRDTDTELSQEIQQEAQQVKPVALSDIKDGASNTLMVGERDF